MKNVYSIKFVALVAVAMLYSSVNAQNTFPSTGKVGIGTTTPGANLEINENDAKIQIRDKSTTFPYPEFFIQAIDGTLSIKHGYGNTGLTLNNSGYLGIGTTTPTQRLTVNGKSYFMGNVGINCSNPGAPLVVNGKIVASEIEVLSVLPCSDFVFENGYRLKSLYEVEQFVKENKHLPEVPSAKEFAENGYNIGQMDDLLLRKVEELTLYVIELQKQNDALKAEVSKLQK